MDSLNEDLSQINTKISKVSTSPTTTSTDMIKNQNIGPKIKKLKTNNGNEFQFGIETYYSAWRANTLFTKEPGTIKWMDETMKSDSVLYDIGANIGIYSIYAMSLHNTLKVVGFEPEALNYAEFHRNLHINTYWNRAIILPTAIGNQSTPSLIDLNIDKFEAGNGFHSVVGNGKKQRETIFLWSLDSLFYTFQLPTPTHLKIDVENGEFNVLSGSSKLLQEPTLKHLLVEVKSSKDQEKVKQFLSQLGWSFESLDISENLFFAKH